VEWILVTPLLSPPQRVFSPFMWPAVSQCFGPLPALCDVAARNWCGRVTGCILHAGHRRQHRHGYGVESSSGPKRDRSPEFRA
jgi:hypothetical protein